MNGENEMLCCTLLVDGFEIPISAAPVGDIGDEDEARVEDIVDTVEAAEATTYLLATASSYVE